MHVLRTTKNKYYKDHFKQTTGNPKPQWKAITEILRCNSFTCDEYKLELKLSCDNIADKFKKRQSKV